MRVYSPYSYNDVVEILKVLEGPSIEAFAIGENGYWVLKAFSETIKCTFINKELWGAYSALNWIFSESYDKEELEELDWILCKDEFERYLKNCEVNQLW